MLARLETIDEVVAAAVDHRGELLRLGAKDEGALEQARQALTTLGYEASDADPEEQRNRRWYGSATVHELSREEARVIADRVVPPFTLDHGLGEAVAERLASAVTAALFECFTAHTRDAPANSIRSLCSQAVAEAASVLVGADAARDLAARIDAGLGESAVRGGE